MAVDNRTLSQLHSATSLQFEPIKDSKSSQLQPYCSLRHLSVLKLDNSNVGDNKIFISHSLGLGDGIFLLIYFPWVCDDDQRAATLLCHFPSNTSGLSTMTHQISGTQLSSKTPSLQDFMEDKISLGSTPPNCYNKCNACSPCNVIQVPTPPTHHQEHRAYHNPAPSRVVAAGANKKYSNYKPMGWKCKCGHRLFNP
eukprot:Gb_39245 [translate_table: standard]